VDILLADINKNGSDEIVVANNATPGGAQWTDSYIFSFDKKDLGNPQQIKLPTLGATGVSVGDLNDDDYPEIVTVIEDWLAVNKPEQRNIIIPEEILLRKDSR